MSTKFYLKLLSILLAMLVLLNFLLFEITFDPNNFVLIFLGGWFIGSKIGNILGKVLIKIDEE